MIDLPKRFSNGGQAMILLVFICAFIFSLILEIATIGLSSLGLSNEYFLGLTLVTKAEGYLENAALRHLRDPTYTGESLQDEDISCTIQINTLNPESKDLVCSCQKDQRIRTVGMNVTYNQGIYVFSAIKER